MNRYIKEQLNKCKLANIPDFAEDDLEIIIPKYNNIDLLPNLYYNIKIEDYIINEPDNFTLSSNWNRGTKPPENLLSIRIEEIQGKMIKVDAIGKSTNKVWNGWLPRKAITILEKIG